LKSENLIIIPNKSIENALINKNIIMIVNDSENDDSSVDVLKNMAKALKMDFENDIHLQVLLDQEKYNISKLLRGQIVLIAFGIDASRLSLQIEEKLYKIFTLGESRIILTDKINTLDKPRKIKLWQLLQQVFPQN
jgi:hypothetical protein